MILHIDCNSFFASCEVSLRPDLVGKPVVVANCNEAGGGIILALTSEAKALGFKRGMPVFQCREALNTHHVAVFPANLPKYVDISRRLMQVVKDEGVVLNFTQYSVDEFFGQLPTDDPAELRDVAGQVKERINQCTGIPVSCGLSLTFTLAKVATWYAKHYPAYQGVCVLPSDKLDVALRGIPLPDVWGIGRRTAPRLEAMGMHSAWDFAQKPEYLVQRLLHTPGVRTWKELHGTPCIDIEHLSRQRSIMHSRTFAYMTDSKSQLQTYLCNYAAAAARKLRDQHSVCLAVTVFVGTNPHRDDLEQYGGSETVRLKVATADTSAIANAAIDALEKVYRPGYRYKRAGILLSDIVGDEAVQLDMFDDTSAHMERSRRLMAAMDKLNTRYGMDSVRMASQGFENTKPDLTDLQPMKNETTNFDDIIEVR